MEPPQGVKIKGMAQEHCAELHPAQLNDKTSHKSKLVGKGDANHFKTKGVSAPPTLSKSKTQTTKRQKGKGTNSPTKLEQAGHT